MQEFVPVVGLYVCVFGNLVFVVVGQSPSFSGALRLYILFTEIDTYAYICMLHTRKMNIHMYTPYIWICICTPLKADLDFPGFLERISPV